MKRSSLQTRVSNFMPEKVYENDPWRHDIQHNYTQLEGLFTRPILERVFALS
jgi:hypothetical protein